MAKLHYIHGTMGSGKSLDLIRVAYNYKEKGMNVLVFKPIIDIRSGINKCIISSRTGAQCDAEWIYESTQLYSLVLTHSEKTNVDAVIIDEVQFLSCKQIIELSDIVTKLNIPVLAYGLKNNFKGELFDAIKILLAYADEVRSVIGLCWCGKRANHNAKIINNRVIKSGDEIDIGGNEKYVALCNKHFKDSNLGN